MDLLETRLRGPRPGYGLKVGGQVFRSTAYSRGLLARFTRFVVRSAGLAAANATPQVFKSRLQSGAQHASLAVRMRPLRCALTPLSAKACSLLWLVQMFDLSSMAPRSRPRTMPLLGILGNLTDVIISGTI